LRLSRRWFNHPEKEENIRNAEGPENTGVKGKKPFNLLAISPVLAQ
jgi:hypothetical protein